MDAKTKKTAIVIIVLLLIVAVCSILVGAGFDFGVCDCLSGACPGVCR
jgi:hypothetical protein